MKRFLITCDTYWCGTETIYRAEANSELELEDIAEQLAYDNFYEYFDEKDIFDAEGYSYDEMTNAEIEEAYDYIDESGYYWSNIEEFDGTDEEWENYEGEIYKVNSVI